MSQEFLIGDSADTTLIQRGPAFENYKLTPGIAGKCTSNVASKLFLCLDWFDWYHLQLAQTRC